ncbi:hypothetical protein HG530_011338 [Fusarium avenaceum]|nr:hypothetical protein HG530_011338 [Fusarium avenaceum]
MAAGNSNTDHLLSQNASEVVLIRMELPTNLLDLLVNELQGKVVQGLLDRLILTKDGLNATNGVENLTPNKSVGFLAEALEECQKSRSGTVARKGKVSGRTDDRDLVLGAKLVKLGAQLGKTLRRVVDTVEASGSTVKLVEVLIDITDSILLASMSLQVVRHTLEECLNTEMVGKHANGGATLEVADGVENLVDVESIADRDVDGMTGANTIETESSLHTLVDKLSPDLPVGVQVINSVPADPGSEALVEPELIPPVHSDKVAKPLMSQLVGNDVGNGVLESGV